MADLVKDGCHKVLCERHYACLIHEAHLHIQLSELQKHIAPSNVICYRQRGNQQVWQPV